jgi:hypothetical protein
VEEVGIVLMANRTEGGGMKCEHETVAWKCKKCGAYVIDHLAAMKEKDESIDGLIIAAHRYEDEIKRRGEQIAALTARNKELTEALEKSFAIGYNDDCMFCGFKDRIAKAALGGDTCPTDG